MHLSLSRAGFAALRSMERVVHAFEKYNIVNIEDVGDAGRLQAGHPLRALSKLLSALTTVLKVSPRPIN